MINYARNLRHWIFANAWCKYREILRDEIWDCYQMQTPSGKQIIWAIGPNGYSMVWIDGEPRLIENESLKQMFKEMNQDERKASD